MTTTRATGAGVGLCPSDRNAVRERGSTTVEIAIALPAVVVVLGAVLTLGSATTVQLRCADAARAGAREAALGSAEAEVVAVATRVAGEGAAVRVVHDDEWVTVQVERAVVPWHGLGAGGGLLSAHGSATARVEP